MTEKPILSIETYKDLDTSNRYFEHLSRCSEGLKKYDEKEEKQMHHIIPQYVFNKSSATDEDLAFRDSTDNLIELSTEDHILAHELLYEVYGNIQDKGATKLLQGLKNESRHIWKILGAEASHLVQKEKGKNFWDKGFQKEMAKRSMEKPDALETRRAGGKKGGRNKSIDVTIKAHERFVFSFKEKEVLCIQNCQTGGDVLKELKKYEKITNQETSIDRATPLLTGDRKLAYGWSCQKIEDKVQDSPTGLAVSS